MYDKDVAYKLAKIIHEGYKHFYKLPNMSSELEKQGKDSDYGKGYFDCMDIFEQCFYDWVVEPLEIEFEFDIKDYDFD